MNVAVQTPAHSQVGGLLTYSSLQPLLPGQLVRVPLGRREVLGVVWSAQQEAPEGLDPSALRQVGSALQGLPMLQTTWRALVQFTAQYYQRSLGEVALSALPPQLRTLSQEQLTRRLKKPAEHPLAPEAGPDLSSEQIGVLEQIHAGPGPFLLFGSTGSGKTEVYLQAVQQLLDRDPEAQALLLVPEINLTPQLESRVRERFGETAVVSMHSGLTGPQRLRSWMAAHTGAARIVLGTRMAIFASMPRLQLIVVDEEHDPSYKQQEGARYSARDLAVYRARLQ